MTRGISRRRLLGRAGALTLSAGGFAALSTPALADAHVLYMLDPRGDHTCVQGACSSCNACRLHAANSYFATADAADLHRAHPFCKCGVVAGPTVSTETYVALFGASIATRPSVDLRSRWVQDALATGRVPAPSDVAPSRDQASANEPAMSAPPAAKGPHNDALRVRHFHVAHPSPRRLRILLDLDRQAYLDASLVASDGRAISRRSFPATAGATAHDFRVPNGAPPGDYRLRIHVKGETTPRKTLSRRVTIELPPPKYRTSRTASRRPSERLAQAPPPTGQ